MTHHASPAKGGSDDLSAARRSGDSAASGADGADAPQRGAWTTGLVVGTVLVVLLPYYVVSTAGRQASLLPEYQTALLLCFGITTLAGAALARLLWSGRPDFFLLTLSAYTYVFLGIAPIAQLRAHAAPGSRYILASEATTSSALILSALAVYYLFYRLNSRRPADRGATVRGVAFGRLVLTTSGGMLMFAIYVFVVGAGTLFAYRSERGTAAHAALGGTSFTALVAALATVPVFVAILGFIQSRRQGRRVDFMVMAVLTAMVLLISNPISTSRFTFGVFVGSLVIVGFKLGSTPARFRAVVIGLVTALLIVFPYADYFRNAQTAELSRQPGLAQQYLESLDYDSYAQVALTVRYVQQNGHTHGKQALGGLLAPVPRSIWPAKPRDTGIVLGEFAGYAFTSISAPLWAEAYIDGGWVATLLLFAALGWFSAWADRRYRASVATGYGVFGIAVPAVALYQIMTLRGSFLQQAPRLMLLLGLFWFISAHTRKAVKRRQPRADEAGRARGSSELLVPDGSIHPVS
jgi:oligosaccharide repeat unit polymerase